MKFVLAIVLVAGAISFAGCEASVGGRDNVKVLQDAITEQLPKELKESGQGVVTVSKVVCKSTDDAETNYDCVASISGTDSSGEKGSADLDIVGKCDDDGCKWETK